MTVHQRAKNHRYPAPTIAKHARADEPNAHGLTVDRLTRTAGSTTPAASAATGHCQTTCVNPHTTSAIVAKIETKPSVEPIIVGLTTYVPRDETAAMRACSRPATSAMANAATIMIVPPRHLHSAGEDCPSGHPLRPRLLGLLNGRLSGSSTPWSRSTALTALRGTSVPASLSTTGGIADENVGLPCAAALWAGPLVRADRSAAR